MRTTVIIAIGLLAAGSGLAAQDQLRAAKDQYASAAYEEALATLGSLQASQSTLEVARQVDQYRAFSLFALGRTKEAESVAESMIRREPLARLDSADASPRLEQMFTDVRKRLLPTMVRERFRAARTALDQKNFAAAEPTLREAHLMIVEAEKLGVKDDGLGDLSVLVDGFLQLARFESEKRTSSPAATEASSGATGASVAASPIATPPAASNAVTAIPVASSPAPAAASRSAAPARARPYSVEDEGVSPPVALDQRMPAVSADMRRVIAAFRANGVLDVTIDETGRVVDATIRQSLSPPYDAMVVRTARGWKYRPAMKDGVPVPYVKTILLVP
jgi:TonB family protein